MKRTSAYIRVRELRGQVSGTTLGRARTKSASNNTQVSSYIREGVARGIGVESLCSTEASSAEVSARTIRRQSLAPHNNGHEIANTLLKKP